MREGGRRWEADWWERRRRRVRTQVTHMGWVVAAKIFKISDIKLSSCESEGKEITTSDPDHPMSQLSSSPLPCPAGPHPLTRALEVFIIELVHVLELVAMAGVGGRSMT